MYVCPGRKTVPGVTRANLLVTPETNLVTSSATDSTGQGYYQETISGLDMLSYRFSSTSTLGRDQEI